MLFSVMNKDDEEMVRLEAATADSRPTKVIEVSQEPDEGWSEYIDTLIERFGAKATCNAIASQVGGPYGYLKEA